MMKSVLGAFRRKTLMPLFFCLFFSAMAASLWFNRLPENIQETLGILGRAWTSRPQCRLRAEEGAFYSVFVRRAGLAAVVWLAGMTPCSLAVLCLASSAVGFSMAAVLSALTAETGFLALPLFLLALFPQCLFYAPAAAILVRWGLKEEKKVRAAAFLILLAVLAAGSAAEVWLNPKWISWIGAIFFY
ncbi:MAG: stage II sporulation protein M [Clostridium sp.]|nr:stage II sporulation protein M [Clostridium sp.]